MKLFNSIICFGLALLQFSSCKDFVQIDAPQDQIVTEKVYENDETAISAVRGIYAQMMTTTGFASGGNSSVTVLAGRSADEFFNFSANDYYIQFSVNNILPENIVLQTGLWQETYKYIYYANAILENLEKSSQVSALVKQQLQGEAKFIRAFCHFYLTNLFGDVPLILTTDYRLNRLAAKSTQEQIYLQIIKDLEEAKAQLNENYPSAERIRVNKWAATAFLARVYLYHQEWSKAEQQASAVIAKTDQYKLVDDLNLVFLKNSKETIWQLAPTSLSINTKEGQLFILNAAPTTSKNAGMSAGLLAAFEQGDQRLSKWVGVFSNGTTQWTYPFKYKIRTGGTPRDEYSMVLRLAEQYLIRAEARINLDRIGDGITDLNTLRTRARATATPSVPNPLPALSLSLAKADALLAVEKERRIELFSEWGHRWLDLKRTHRADAVLGPLKAPNWQSTDVFYPIPSSEILNDPNLQN